VSGGAIHVPGTIHQAIPALPNRVAEWNFYLDPFAADIVFKSGVPLMLIPLDVTHIQGVQPLLFGKEFVHQLRLHARSQASRLLIWLIYLWQLTTPQYPATPVWDGVVAAITAEPKLGVDWRKVSIRILSQPEARAGQTLVDEGGLVNAHVCLRGDQTAFEAAFLALVGR
jgi:pyrimidine-specific ribonucleoside hydrolase